ncbi:NADH-quinone oxidoreductase subunit A [Thorsellia kenyensis]|uniref:NADH-quinone oxidoreductase subunit A n=1 Tax=Thorsellia kenyensis TaxID=1549888 RepID=A0ABV6C6U2_9GAMM
MTSTLLSHHWSFAIFILGGLGLCIFMLLGGYLLGGRAKARAKNVPFESGVDSVGSARMRMSAKFYLIAMFFVIFDVEALYLFAYAVAIKETGWVGFIEACIFVLILLSGLIYLAKIGALDWTPLRSQRKPLKVIDMQIDHTISQGKPKYALEQNNQATKEANQ